MSLVQAPFVRLYLRMKGVTFGNGNRYFGFPVIQRYRHSVIRLGSNTLFRSGQHSNVLALAHPVTLTTLSRSARIVIGNGVGLSGTSICAAAEISIGNETLIGADVLITDTDHHALFRAQGDEPTEPSCAPISIGSYVFIGARAIILKGSNIGDHAVVGAGAVVAGSVPSGAVVGGNPARVIGSVFPSIKPEARSASLGHIRLEGHDTP